MNYLKIITSVLVVGLSAALVGCAPLTENTPQATADTEGHIILTGDGQGPCYIPIEIGWHMLNRIKGCSTDSYDTIQLDRVPSALTITVMDHGWCENYTDNWAFRFNTIKQPTSTDPIKFYTIYKAARDSIVVPGVRKDDQWGDADGDDMRNEVSCVKVERY